MNKYFTRIAFVVSIFFIAATTLTRAQNTASNPSSTGGGFTDVLQVNFSAVRLFPQNNNGTGGIVFSNVLAYNFTNHFSAGAGIGYEFLSVDYSTTASGYVLLFADLRWYFNPGKIVTPFLNFNSGYAPDFDNGGEIFTGLNFGVKIITKSNVGVEFAVGLKYAYYYYHFFLPEYGGGLNKSEITSSDNFVFVPFTFGLSF